jgi:hypothetical protein
MNPQKAIRTPPDIGTDKIKELIQASYSRNTPAREIGNKYGLRLDDSLSNAEHKVWIDRKNRPTVAFTGTRKIGDWGTDLLLGLGLEKYSTRFRDSKKLMEDVRKKYSAPATIVSHSLGGSLSEYAGGKRDKIITVDKGVGLAGVGKTIGKNQIDIRTSNDPVSLLSNTQKNLGKKIVIKDKKNFNLLEAHNFRKLDKLKNKII